MSSRFWRAALRRRGALAAALALLIVLSGSALAASRGASWRLGYLETLTGYVTGISGSHAAELLRIINASTASGARAIRAEAKSPTAGTLYVRNSGGGPAAEFVANSGKPTFKVNTTAKIVKLNADRLDGLDSTQLQRATSASCAVGQKVSAITADGIVTCSTDAVDGGNAQTLDGKDSSQFAEADAETWHEIGASGQPGFITQSCFDPGPFDYFPMTWTNYDTGVHNTAAFYMDPFGRVHLKGLVRNGSTTDHGSDLEGADCGKIFQLPPGYRPSSREVHVTLTYHSPSADVNSVRVARISIDSNGLVWAAENSNRTWLSLDSISFRATN